jgi:hypothetical protein
VWYTDFQLSPEIIVPDSATDGSLFPPDTTVLPEFHPENQGPIIIPWEASLAPALNPRPAQQAMPAFWRG